MLRTILFVFASVIASASVFAQGQGPATYILQVSSNLGCDTLEIEVVSTKDQSSQRLIYKTSAFAATVLPAGDYVFGGVTCTKTMTNSPLICSRTRSLNYL